MQPSCSACAAALWQHCQGTHAYISHQPCLQASTKNTATYQQRADTPDPVMQTLILCPKCIAVSAAAADSTPCLIACHCQAATPHHNNYQRSPACKCGTPQQTATHATTHAMHTTVPGPTGGTQAPQLHLQQKIHQPKERLRAMECISYLDLSLHLCSPLPTQVYHT